MSFHRLLVPGATKSVPRARAECADYLDSRPQSPSPAIVSPEGPSPQTRARHRGALEGPFRWCRRQVGVLSGLTGAAIRGALLVLGVPAFPQTQQAQQWPERPLLEQTPDSLLSFCCFFLFFSASEGVGRCLHA